ncbi:hypothetical protein [Halovivax limisalsi]|uniref:hypothetical protein n=1 Tax=Halovivax limisalsi TaxID=1453760 RepID=UPI001FFDAC85|nr:hypothetical protein [Halovivax limisalsi]
MSGMGRLGGAVRKPIRAVVRPIAPVIVVGVVVALLAVGIGMVTDWVELVPSTTIPVVEYPLSSTTVLFLIGFVVGLVIGTIGLLYRRHRTAIAARWRGYSTWVKSMVVGLVSALLVAADFTIGVALGRVPVTSLVLAILLTWPIVVGLVLLWYRRSPRSEGLGESVRTAYVLTRGLEPRTLAAIVSILTAVAVGLLVTELADWWLGGVTRWVPLVIASLTWVVVTLLAYNRYEGALAERTDLTIESLQPSTERETTELTVANTAGRTVDLSSALIRDTDLNLYRPELDATLKPGQRATFEITDAFALPPNHDAIELPLGYDLKRGAETPAIFTTDSVVHHLQWTDEASAVIDRDSTTHLAEDVGGATGGSKTSTDRTAPGGGDPVRQD